MTMSNSEKQVIRNVIKRLRCEPHDNGFPREADRVREALTGDAKLYLETWVTGALVCLLDDEPDQRDVKLALSLSR